eukprot:11227081-Lingulodinium_polyedra.AAC.1
MRTNGKSAGCYGQHPEVAEETGDLATSRPSTTRTTGGRVARYAAAAQLRSTWPRNCTSNTSGTNAGNTANRRLHA